MYLLDTNTVSYIIKGGYPALDARLKKVAPSRIAISTITEAELWFGAARNPEAVRLHELLKHFLLSVTILPWDSDAAMQYGQMRAFLEQEGRALGNLDMLIGAHALAANCTLVTHDQAFRRIPKLRVEDWNHLIAPRR